MLTRICAGGVVFFKDKVFLLQNDKGDWVLPKGVIRSNELAQEVALQRVKTEGGIEAKIISPAGETSYEFYSYSRKKPVCNKIDWFIMEAEQDSFLINPEEGFQNGGFFALAEALERITYSQERSLVNLAFRKFKFFRDEEIIMVGS